jgi:hypothetical protein
MWMLMENKARHGATDPLEADNRLHTTESKFGLLHCTEYQKTLYATQ